MQRLHLNHDIPFLFCMQRHHLKHDIPFLFYKSSATRLLYYNMKKIFVILSKLRLVCFQVSRKHDICKRVI
jgi:hypothetical protein